MGAKDYLMQVRLMDSSIRQKMSLLTQMRMSATGLRAVTYDGDKVQNSPGDRMADVMARIVDLEYEIIDDTLKLVQKKSEVVSDIFMVGDEKLERVLYLRYVEYLTFSNIAEEMDIDIRQVFRLHGKALYSFEKNCLKSKKV